MLNLLVAVAIGAAIMWFGIRTVRLLAMPPPPEPDPDDLVEVAVDYRCSVCGIRLTITQAYDEEVRAPRHCREEMVLVGDPEITNL